MLCVFFVKDMVTKKTFLLDRRKIGYYMVPISHSSSSTPHHASSSVKVSPSKWHRHLGHPTTTIVKSIMKLNKLVYSFNNDSSVCDACQLAKIHQLPYSNFI